MTELEYQKLSPFGQAKVKLTSGIEGFLRGIGAFFTGIPKGIAGFFKRLAAGVKNYGRTFANGDVLTKLSYIVMGAGNLFRGQIFKGLLYLAAEAAYIFYMVSSGLHCIAGLKTLGTVQRGWYFDEELGIDVMRENGDNSMLILLYGIFAVFLTVVFLVLYISSIRSAAEAEKAVKSGAALPKFKEDIAEMLDSKFHKTLLIVPAAGVLMFTVVPLIYMILLAFTNYDKDHQVPANLFTWVGFSNFKTMLGSGSALAKTFWPVLGWTIVWAIFATFLNYIFGIVLALLINKKGIRFKAVFRTLFVLAIAVPQFVSLLVMKNVLAEAGPLNVLLMEWGLIDTPLPFLTDPTWARVSVIVVNLWVGIPYTMLITSGILMNIPSDLYEAARIDGASPVVMFTKITMPYVLFVTTL